MKSRNFWKLLLTLVIMLTVLTGCFLNKTIYHSFRQDRSDIEKVEICTYNHDSGVRTPIVQLSDEYVEMLLAELSALECRYISPFGPPILTYGDKVICITYLDGEVELIGEYNIGWISSEGKSHRLNYHFELLGIREIIEKYSEY